MSETVFITGASGFIGQSLAAALLERQHRVFALVRNEKSAERLPKGCEIVIGDPLNSDTYRSVLTGEMIFVQLVGARHPKPWQKNLFEEIDGRSGREATKAAISIPVRSFVYLSVAQPAPIMGDYIRVRSAVEKELISSGLNVAIVRPWYVLGPGRRWPLMLKPIYWLLESLPATRASAQRLGMINISQLTRCLVNVVETPHKGVRILNVPDIKALA